MKYLVLLTGILIMGCAKETVTEAVVKAQSCTTIQTANGAVLNCPDGSSAVILNGSNGLNGVSCSTQPVTGGALITCGTTQTFVANGDKGDTGSNGTVNGIYITEIINPCGPNFANDEVLLRLSNGRILALYDGGSHQDRLTLLAVGNYVTTDTAANCSCSFTVTSTYQITNQALR